MFGANVTTTRRGWRAALDSSLLLALVVCGSVTALLTASPAAPVVGDRTMAVASAGSAATFVARRTGVVGKGSLESWFVEANAVAPFASGRWSTGTSEPIARDVADDDDDDDDDGLEHRPSRAPGLGIKTGLLNRLEQDPSVSLESDGHSLRAPPQ